MSEVEEGSPADLAKLQPGTVYPCLLASKRVLDLVFRQRCWLGDCILELDGATCTNCDKADIDARLSSNNGTVSMTVAFTLDYRRGLAHRRKVEVEVWRSKPAGDAGDCLEWLLGNRDCLLILSVQAKLRRLISRHEQLEVEEQQLQHRLDVKNGVIVPSEDNSGMPLCFDPHKDPQLTSLCLVSPDSEPEIEVSDVAAHEGMLACLLVCLFSELALCDVPSAILELLRQRLGTDVPDLLSAQVVDACSTLEEAKAVLGAMQARWQADM